MIVILLGSRFDRAFFVMLTTEFVLNVSVPAERRATDGLPGSHARRVGEGDVVAKDAPELHDAEQQQQEDRQDERELDERLSVLALSASGHRSAVSTWRCVSLHGVGRLPPHGPMRFGEVLSMSRPRDAERSIAICVKTWFRLVGLGWL